MPSLHTQSTPHQNGTTPILALGGRGHSLLLTKTVQHLYQFLEAEVEPGKRCAAA